MKITFKPTLLLIICLSFMDVTSSISEEDANEIESIYSVFLDIRSGIYTKVETPDLSVDELRKSLDEFSKKVEPFVKTDEGKAFAAIAKYDLADIVAMESACNMRIKPEENEPHVRYMERVWQYAKQIYDDEKKNVDAVFASADVPDNSYLKILYHQRAISMENNKTTVTTKHPTDVREHCDALMNGPVFDRNATILQSPIPIDYIWYWKDYENLRKNIVQSIQGYLYDCRLFEIAKKYEGLGSRWIEEESKRIRANLRQDFLNLYPLSKYPLLEDVLDADER